MDVSLGLNLVRADANLKRLGPDAFSGGKDFEGTVIVQVRRRGARGLRRERGRKAEQ
jgi:hypothetical protein